ncbi:N-acetylglucosamine kinase [Gynurincola endophyticus]|jgi:glucosamine kinase|uniref:N-acetylglucosamine kinase n=1 Tax=Gynurincola endophyticus TaxID=2479004 RepID=UPI000F8E1B3A|nr:N-acetylglucosamine kinase [Gynurincola endophyticus]
MLILIADSGATKTAWTVLENGRNETFFSQGIAPYLMSQEQIESILTTELLPSIKKTHFDAIYYYGTGCKNPNNAALVHQALTAVFNTTPVVEVSHDMMAAAKATCQNEAGIACILGTGSNSAYFDGTDIVHNRSGIGFILGDEGSGAYLGKKVIQYYLYETFDVELKEKFDQKYQTNPAEILENVYKKPLPNRYLADFTKFLAENRNHFMIENIIEDGLNDFFFTHLCRYEQSESVPIHFVGGVAAGFSDVLESLCSDYGFQPGKILNNPMTGLIEYHQSAMEK